MKLIDRGGAARELLHRKRLEGKIDDARVENERLRAENHVLREEGRHERGEMQQLVAAMGRDGERRPLGRTRRFVALAAAAGGAYVLGARAGRERYEQILRRWRRLRAQSRRSIGAATRELDTDRGEDGTVTTSALDGRAVGPA
jgi:hypothetical protein